MRHLNKVTHNLYTYSESLSIHIFQQNECKHRIYPISISCKCLSKFQYFGYPHIPTVLLYKMHVCISRICNDVVTGRGGNPIFSQVYRNFLSIFLERSGFWIDGVAGRPCALRSRIFHVEEKRLHHHTHPPPLSIFKVMTNCSIF